MTRRNFRFVRVWQGTIRFLASVMLLVMGAGCIRVASDPVETASDGPALVPSPVDILPTDEANTPVAESSEGVETPLPNMVTAEPEIPSAAGARDSSLPPISVAVRWGHDAQADVLAMRLVSLDGGPLPDIVAASADGTVFTLGLNQEEYWRKRFTSPVTALAIADLDRDEIGDVLVADAAGVTVLERGEIRWRFDSAVSIAHLLPVDPAHYLGASLLAVSEDGMLLALDDDGDLLWSSPINGEQDGTTQIDSARLAGNSAHAIVAATISGRLSAIDNGGRQMWQVELGSAVNRLLTVDLDDDGNKEIVVATEGGLMIVSHAGAIMSRWLIADSINDVIASDVDGDGSVELVASSSSQPGTISLLDDGAIRWQYHVDNRELGQLSAGDLDGDGPQEILVTHLDGQVSILDGDGQIRSQFNAGDTVAEIRLADMNGDPGKPQPELILRAGSFIYLMELSDQTAESGESRTPETLASPVESAEVTERTQTVLPHYQMELTLDHIGHRVQVSQSTTVVNDSPDTWDELIFNVSTAYWPRIFALHGSTVSSEEQSERVDLPSSLANTMLSTQLSPALAPGEAVTVHFDYSLELPRLDPVGWGPTGNAGWGPNLMQLGDWYPALVPYEPGKGWVTWQFVPVGDPVIGRLADFDVVINGGPGVQVAAAGRVSSGEDGDRFHLSAVRAFAFTASPDYGRVDGSAGGIPVQLFLTSANQPHAPVVMQTAIEAILLFAELFGPYPYPELVIADNGFLTSNEYSGFISLGGYLFDVYDGSSDSLLVAITVHEVAHQWWYGAVGNDQVNEPWLDEGLAMLSELLYYERVYPALSEAWWDFRVDRWNPSGYAGSSIYEFSDSAAFVHNVYGQSAHFLQRLRQSMGHDALLTFLRDYYQRYRGSSATGEQFFDLAQTYAPEDLSALRAQYFK